MMKQVLIAIAFASVGNAATTAIFLLNGKEVRPEEALLASAKGQAVYKCQPMVAQLSKSGTSISLKTSKKAE